MPIRAASPPCRCIFQHEFHAGKRIAVAVHVEHLAETAQAAGSAAAAAENAAEHSAETARATATKHPADKVAETAATRLAFALGLAGCQGTASGLQARQAPGEVDGDVLVVGALFVLVGAFVLVWRRRRATR